MNPLNNTKKIKYKKSKKLESKIEKIPSKINLNSSETNKELKQEKFLTKKIAPLRINNKKKIIIIKIIQKKERIQKKQMDFKRTYRIS